MNFNPPETEREEYKLFCFIYGRQHIEKLFSKLEGYKETRKAKHYKTVKEETKTYFKGL